MQGIHYETKRMNQQKWSIPSEIFALNYHQLQLVKFYSQGTWWQSVFYKGATLGNERVIQQVWHPQKEQETKNRERNKVRAMKEGEREKRKEKKFKRSCLNTLLNFLALRALTLKNCIVPATAFPAMLFALAQKR